MSCCGKSAPAEAARVKAQEAKHFKVAGHDVAFPRQPYGVQLVFMDKLIRTIEGGHNALLEAPTGCGKTLALLCGALAWQTKCNEQQAEQERADQIAYAQLALDSAPHARRAWCRMGWTGAALLRCTGNGKTAWLLDVNPHARGHCECRYQSDAHTAP